MTEQITTESFFYKVKNALQSKQPFSFVRFSDGETMLLNREAYYSEYVRIIKTLWGYEPEEREFQELSEYLITALHTADIIGFPTERHLRRKDYFRDAKYVYSRKVGWTSSDVYASVDVGYEMLYASKKDDMNALYIDYFRELFSMTDTLNYVSCWNLDEEFKREFGIKNVNSFQIAPEPKFTSGYEGERHFPEQFKKIKEWIASMDCTGQLCLVGGGVISKIYNTWFKEQGGVSLDIGACFDLWKGRATRGKDRGLDKEFLTYKL